MECPWSDLIMPEGTPHFHATRPHPCARLRRGELQEGQALPWEEAPSEELLATLQITHKCHAPVLTSCLPCGCSFLVSVPLWTFAIRDGIRGKIFFNL